jgi:hypothetical protein
MSDIIKLVRITAILDPEMGLQFIPIRYDAVQSDIELYLACSTHDLSVRKGLRRLELAKSYIGRPPMATGIKFHGYKVLPCHPISCEAWCYESDLDSTKEKLVAEIKNALLSLSNKCLQAAQRVG